MGQGCKPKTHGEEVQGVEVCLGRLTLEPLPSPGPEIPSSLRGLVQLLDVGNVGRRGIIEGNAHFKRKRAVQTGECLNSPRGLERHSPSDQPTLNITAEKGANKLADRKKSSIDPWPRLIGRANEEQIIINGHPVTALLDTGSQVTHISEAFCQANEIQINLLDQLVEIEGSGGTILNI